MVTVIIHIATDMSHKKLWNQLLLYLNLRMQIIGQIHLLVLEIPAGNYFFKDRNTRAKIETLEQGVKYVKSHQ